MQVTVGNQLRIENPSEQLLTWCKKQLNNPDTAVRECAADEFVNYKEVNKNGMA